MQLVLFRIYCDKSIDFFLLFHKYAHILLVFDQFTKRVVLMNQLKFMADISHLNVLLSKIYLHVNAHVLYTRKL